MGKWIAIMLAVMIAAAVVGFMVDAVRVIAGFLVAICLAVLAVRVFLKRG
ncbi:hypothetical protein [Phenylobacterium sp.]|jgi:hypothetical protein